MPGLRDKAIQWYRKAFGAPSGSDIREEGLATVLDGNTAVALSEATIARHAVLGGTMPAAGADSVWLCEVEHGSNLFGQAIGASSRPRRVSRSPASAQPPSCPARTSPPHRTCSSRQPVNTPPWCCTWPHERQPLMVRPRVAATKPYT